MIEIYNKTNNKPTILILHWQDYIMHPSRFIVTNLVTKPSPITSIPNSNCQITRFEI